MTFQQLDNIVCEHPRVDLSGHKIDSGHILFKLPIPISECDIPDGTVTATVSSLWRGYLATFRLNSDGTFELILIENPYFRPPFRQEFNLIYEGDFKITFQGGLEGGSKTIPFENGVIVEDELRWDVYPPDFRPRTMLEFRSAPLSDTNMSAMACRICHELGIQTVGELYDRRSEFEAHPESGELQRRSMIRVLARMPRE